MKSRIFYLVIVILYIVLKPFYFFDSGLPQIADLIISISFIPLLFSFKEFYFKHNKLFKWLLLFNLIVVLVNGIYYLFSSFSDSSFLISIAFQVFNTFCFFIFIKVLEDFDNESRVDVLTIVSLGILCSLVLQSTFLLLGFEKETKYLITGRYVVYFNNPNQLSYYVLILSTAIILIHKKIQFSRYVTPVVLSLSFLLILASSSRIAIVGLLFITGYYFYANFKKNFIQIFIVFVGVFFSTSAIFYEKVNLDSEIKRLQLRYVRKDTTGLNLLERRGVDRLYKYPYKLLYGAGEGNTKRFHKERGQEIHATPAHILFCYGVLGFLTFSFFTYLCFENDWRYFLILLLPIIIYNTFHNGYRFTPIYFIFALGYLVKFKKI